MKQVSVALVLASALLTLGGALFFGRSAGSGGREERPSAEAEASSADLADRLEEALQRLQGLERGLSRLQDELRIARARPAEAPAADAEGPEGEDSAPAREVSKEVLAQARSGRGGEELRSYVHQVIQDERQERAQEQRRRLEEREREAMEFQQGPYGHFNPRVNSLGKKLSLNEAQKQRYHVLLTDYSARIEEIRAGRNREDPVAEKSYRERKNQLIDEFGRLVIQSLTPPQAKSYQELPAGEKSPALEDGPGNGTFTFTTDDGGGGVRAIKMITRGADFVSVGATSGEGAPAPVILPAPPLPQGAEEVEIEVKVGTEK